MPDSANNPQINTSTYDWCIKAFRTTKKMLKLNIKLHDDFSDNLQTVQQGDIFLFNHFARFETFIPQYLIYEATGAYCRSVASHEFFEGDERFTNFLYSVGAVPNNMPNLFPFLARELLHGRKLIIFPEGGMVKDKRVIDEHGKFNIFSVIANARRKHHRGAAVIALALDTFKTAILSDYSKGHYAKVDKWAEQLGFENSEALLVRALKPTTIVPSHITFYPIRVKDNLLHRAVRLFNKEINQRVAEELIIEGNLLFKDTDMDIRFSKPVEVGSYWKWWEKLLLPNVVHHFGTLSELFNLRPDSSHWLGRIHAIGMHRKSNQLRDEYMRSMYGAVTINLSHLASEIILQLYQQGLEQIPCQRFHKILYLCIKKFQQSNHKLHRSLLNPAEYGVVLQGGSNRLQHFLRTAVEMELISQNKGYYSLESKLIEDINFHEVRTENLISVYANELAPLKDAPEIISQAILSVDNVSAREFADYRFDDQLIAYRWDKKQFSKPRYAEINDQQTATEDANWIFLKSDNEQAEAALLIHGFLAAPAEMKGMAEKLHNQGLHVLVVRLKGHGTSPWDLRQRNWQEWFDSVDRGYSILRPYSRRIHLIGFSTGGLLALLFASSRTKKKICSISCISAPVKFCNKNLVFVPLLHHANKLVRWVSSEGLMPFRPNEPENPSINYRHIPIRALYQLQLLIKHILDTPLKIDAPVFFYQADEDPVVELESMNILYDHIQAGQKNKTVIPAKKHGILYDDIGDIQNKIWIRISQLKQNLNRTEQNQ